MYLARSPFPRLFCADDVQTCRGSVADCQTVTQHAHMRTRAPTFTRSPLPLAGGLLLICARPAVINCHAVAERLS